MIFTNDPNDIEMVNYNCPFGKSDHMVLDFEVEMGRFPEENESYWQRRYNYSKAKLYWIMNFL